MKRLTTWLLRLKNQAYQAQAGHIADASNKVESSIGMWFVDVYTVFEKTTKEVAGRVKCPVCGASLAFSMDESLKYKWGFEKACLDHRIDELTAQIESLKEQLKEKLKSEPEKPEEPWLEIHDWPSWAKYAAMDAGSGGKRVWVYEKEPNQFPSNRGWGNGGKEALLPMEWYTIHGELYWRKSLVKRPEGG